MFSFKGMTWKFISWIHFRWAVVVLSFFRICPPIMGLFNFETIQQIVPVPNDMSRWSDILRTTSGIAKVGRSRLRRNIVDLLNMIYHSATAKMVRGFLKAESFEQKGEKDSSHLVMLPNSLQDSSHNCPNLWNLQLWNWNKEWTLWNQGKS